MFDQFTFTIEDVQVHWRHASAANTAVLNSSPVVDSCAAVSNNSLRASLAAVPDSPCGPGAETPTDNTSSVTVTLY